MIAGIVSGSFSSHEWLPPCDDHEIAPGPAGGVPGGGHAARRSRGRRGWRTPGSAPRGCGRACLRLPGCAGSTPPARAAATAAARGPAMVGPTRRPSLSAWRGSRNHGTVVTVSTTSVTPVPTSSGGNSRNTLTMRSHVSPTMASSSTTAMARSGSLAASSVTSRPPIEWPASTAAPTPRWSSTRPSRLGVAGHALRAGGQAERAAVAGRVDRDDLEAEVDEARQRLRVEDPLGREAVDHDERHAAPADGDPHLVTVVEGDGVPSQLRAG